MSPKLFLTLYALLWRAVIPLLHRNKRLADGWEQRLVPQKWATSCDVWIQAASGGEAYLADELLRHFPLSDAPLRVLVTTWTRQGMDVLNKTRSQLADIRPDIHIQTAFFPFDMPTLMRRSLEMASPRAVILLESELWPSLLSACAEKHIPVFIMNGRITEKSLKKYQKLQRISPSFWNAIAPKHINALSEDDASRFSTLFGTSSKKISTQSDIRVIPNIKFDRARTDLLFNTDTTALLLPRTRTKTILLASVRQEEESIILSALIAKLTQNTTDTFIIAPRHLHRADSWISALKKANILSVRRTELTPSHPAQEGAVIIWDTFGELTALYTLCDNVFVGGSLAPLGGQNMMEPLACGRIPCVGPYTKNFLWAMDGKDGLISADLVNVCPDAESVMDNLMQPPQDCHDVKQKFTSWLTPRRGGTAQNIAILLPYLK